MIKTFFFNQISLEIKDGFIAVSLNQRAKELPNIESLKSDERDLLSTIIQLCITGSLEGIEEKMDDLSKDCPFLRTRDREGYCAIHPFAYFLLIWSRANVQELNFPVSKHAT